MGVLSDFDNFEFLTSDFDNLVLILLSTDFTDGPGPPASIACVIVQKSA